MNEEYVCRFPKKEYLHVPTILFILQKCLHESFHLHSEHIQGKRQTKCQN